MDFCHIVAGPWCAMLMALLGAEVIRVESAAHLDNYRRWRQRAGGKDLGLTPSDPRFYESNARLNPNNLNKKSIRVDLRQPVGKDLVRRLIYRSDVVVENFRPGVMERLGLSYDELKQQKSDLIMVSISGMGATGPEASYGSVAHVFAAQGGIGYLTGYPGGIPTSFRASADLVVGTTACFATAAALVHRMKTGEGTHIDVSGRECHSALIGEVFLDYIMNSRNGNRMGNHDPAMAPHNCYRCKDEDDRERWISIAVAADDEWRALCNVMGTPEMATDSRFADGLSRWENQDALDQLIGQWTKSYTERELMQTLQSAGVAAIPSFAADALFHDPHLRQRGSWIVTDHPFQGQRHELAVPWRSATTDSIRYRRAPLFGEHTREILRDVLELTEDEIARLEKENVLY